MIDSVIHDREIPEILLDIARGATKADEPRATAALRAAARQLIELRVTRLGYSCGPDVTASTSPPPKSTQFPPEGEWT